MANRQVRLEPDIVDLVEQSAYAWDCSLSAATNRLLRDLFTEPLPPPPGQRAQAEVIARRMHVPKGTSPHLIAILQRNANG